jgi:polysaccharide biosynthesis protein PslJ
VAAVVPVVATVNRGVWLALMLALVYVAVRFALAGRLRPVAYAAAFVTVAVAISVLSGFAAGAGSRVQADNSTHDRRVLYEEASRKAASSPLLGYGAPSHSAPDGLPAVGTHGQFFLVLLSQGIPGLLFFFAFFAYSAVKFRSLDAPLVFWAHVGLLIFFVESLYYELLPLQLILVRSCSASRGGRSALPRSPHEAAARLAPARYFPFGSE